MLGRNEFERDAVAAKDLRSGAQVEDPREELMERLQAGKDEGATRGCPPIAPATSVRLTSNAMSSCADGSTAVATTEVSCSSTSATRPGSCRWWSIPRAREPLTPTTCAANTSCESL